MHDGDDGWEATAPVASYPDGASRFGVLDLAGNVWEWTADWYGPYAMSAQTDPQGAAAGTSRVSRGAGWSSGGPTALARRPDWFDPEVRESQPRLALRARELNGATTLRRFVLQSPHRMTTSHATWCRRSSSTSTAHPGARARQHGQVWLAKDTVLDRLVAVS